MHAYPFYLIAAFAAVAWLATGVRSFIASRSTIAAWRAQHSTLKLLIERGSPIDVVDASGNTPLALAIRACVDSYWTRRRTPESVQALLAAGASIEGIAFPSGYAAVDELLRVRTAG
jgi:hypothetical protein